MTGNVGGQTLRRGAKSLARESEFSLFSALPNGSRFYTVKTKWW